MSAECRVQSWAYILLLNPFKELFTKRRAPLKNMQNAYWRYLLLAGDAQHRGLRAVFVDARGARV